ncbi:hypothetical protein BDZ89DRAFT_1160988 [Hymenopellis radicata]|nr:hypothetical protein BDZ89DRAFT_1160988 [Hymenopellis radicata]
MPKGEGSRTSPIYLSDDDDDYEPAVVVVVPSQKKPVTNHAGTQKNAKSEPSGTQPNDGRLSRKRKPKNPPHVDQPVAGPSKGRAEINSPWGQSGHGLQSSSDIDPPYASSSNGFHGLPDLPFSSEHFGAAMLQPQFMIPHPFHMHFPPFPFDNPLNVPHSNWVGPAAGMPWDASLWNTPVHHPSDTPSLLGNSPDNPMLVDDNPPKQSRRAKAVTASTDIPCPPSKPLKRIIGMPSDRDPTGQRRAFKVTPTTIIEAEPPITGQYIPNPSRCLIMEQIPKIHRNPDYIRSWCRNVSQCSPLFLAIESCTASAIIEFPSRSLAEKAWSSPKIGNTQIMQSTKGAPREDLIRVWWYKASDPPTEFLVKEFEDGEIEDEEAVKEAVKEAKKSEAKEKKAKKTKEPAPKVLEASHELIPASSNSSPTSPLITSNLYSMISPPLPPLPSHPILPAISPYRAPQLASASFTSEHPPPPPVIPPRSAPSTPAVPDSSRVRAPLPPQAELASNWRPPPLSVKTSRKDLSLMVRTDSEPSDNRHLLDTPPSPTSSVMIIDEPFASHPQSHRVEADRDVDMEIETPISAGLRQDDNIGSLQQSGDSISHGDEVPIVSVSSIDASVSPIVVDSREGSGTPPSEPRAMKNAPKGPSFAMRKELEVRLARQRLELAMSVPSTPALASSELSEVEKLRLKVLESRKKRSLPLPLPTAEFGSVISTPSVLPTAGISYFSSEVASSISTESPVLRSTSPTVADECISPLQEQVSEPGPAPVDSAMQELNDLAVSLINETIQTATLKPLSLKEKLAAKERLLQQQIAGLKAQLTAKQGKSVKEAPKDKSRVDAKENKQPVIHTPVQEMRVQWPEHAYSGILVVSDDEDDDDEDDA